MIPLWKSLSAGLIRQIVIYLPDNQELEKEEACMKILVFRVRFLPLEIVGGFGF